MSRELHEDLLQKLQVGHSFFLPGVQVKDAGYIRKMGYKLGIKLSMRNVLEDEVYGKNGVRVKRMS